MTNMSNAIACAQELADMNVEEAIETRFTCRAFLQTPVEQTVVEAILSRASRAPSGGNLQPWRVYVLAGEPLAGLKSTIAAKLAAGEFFETPAEYCIYPLVPKEPYESRKFQAGEAMYAAMGVERDDDAGRMRQLYRNFEMFGAPVGLFFAIDRIMQQGQWAELGMFMQSVMLLARERALHTAPIAAWALWHETVRRHVGIDEDLMFYCGMALGHADPNAPVNQLRTSRVPLSEFAALRGFDADQDRRS